MNKNNKMLNAFVCVSTLMITGCTTVPVDMGSGSTLGEGGIKNTKTLLAEKSTNISQLNSITDQSEKSQFSLSIASDFAETLSACNRVFSGFEKQANNARWTSFSIAMIGTVAGAVIVPALTASGAEAHKAAIAGWGGLSGAANTAQNVLNGQGLSASESVKARDDLRANFNSAINEYFKATDDQARVMALQKVAASCVSYAVQSATTEVTGGNK